MRAVSFPLTDLPCASPCTSTTVAAVAGVAGSAGSNDEAKNSLRLLSTSAGELVGFFRAGLGGVSLSGAGRLRALPVCLAQAPTPVAAAAKSDEANLGLLGDKGERGNATSTR